MKAVKQSLIGFHVFYITHDLAFKFTHLVTQHFTTNREYFLLSTVILTVMETQLLGLYI
jgi:hypothetical protein